MTAKISLQGIDLAFPSPTGELNTIYEDFNLDIEEGSFTVLLGPSGCGKSTLLNMVDGLLRPTHADAVLVDGTDIRTAPELTRQMAYVFQGPRLMRWKTLEANVEFGLRGLNVQPKESWRPLMEKYFAAVGLKEHMKHYPHQVSGRMQQRAAIVRAWVNEPQVLLMDEPFSHLDEITAAEMRRVLMRLWTQEEKRRTVLFVTHDISEAAQLASDVIVLTPPPSRICFRKHIELPWPRSADDDDVIDLERELRKVFADKAGIRL